MNSKLKKQFGSSDKRTLYRLQNLWSNSYNATIQHHNKNIICKVVDINSTSIALEYSDTFMNELEHIESISIYYGKSKIAHINNPQISRKDINSKILVLEFYNKEKREGMRNALRLKIQSKFTPQIKGEDPLRPYEHIFFSALDLNKEGMLLSTSMRNKHLLPNMTLKNFTISLPNDKDYTFSFQIMHIRQGESNLLLGVKFIKHGNDLKEALSRYALFGAVPTAATPTETVEIMRKAKFSLRRISQAIKVTEVHTPEELLETLGVRLEAYQAANKIDSSVDINSVYDSFDDYSVVFAGRINNKIIATFRITDSDNEEKKFPFESYFKYSDIISFDRKDIAEVSRLGVLTAFQGSDIILALFRTVNREIAKNKKAMVILSSDLLKGIYKDLGAKEITSPIPHPTLENEHLTLLMLTRESYLFGSKILEKNWISVVKDNFKHLYKYGYIEKQDIKSNFSILKKLFRKK